MVKISYPDSVSLSAFLDYVSQSLGLKIIYGDEIKNQTVAFRPTDIELPKNQLLEMLRSMLRLRDLALVAGDVEGWLRVVQLDDVQRLTGEIRSAENLGELGNTNRLVTQLVPLHSKEFATVIKHAKNFLSPKASVIEIPEQRSVLITDYESAVARAVEIMKLVDVAPVEAELRTAVAQHHPPDKIADHIAKLLSDKMKLEGRTAGTLSVRPDLVAGRLVFVGSRKDVDDAIALMDQFDVPSNLLRPTRAYSPKFLTASRMQSLVQASVGSEMSLVGAPTFLLDEESNRLYVTASEQIHARIQELLDEADVTMGESSRPLRMYRPKNRLAGELINTLSAILPNTLSETAETNPETPDQEVTEPASRERALSDNGNPNRPIDAKHSLASQNSGLKKAREEQITPTLTPNSPTNSAEAGLVQTGTNENADHSSGSNGGESHQESSSASQSPQIKRIRGEDFVLSFDAHTNTILAIGSREFHHRFSFLLNELDQRQPQVLIEVTLVAITFNDSMSVGFELASEEQLGDYQSLLFSSFGLSSIDLNTGARVLNPGGGINGILVGPNETPILLRALAAHGNSQIIATPRIIVRDNTAGTISSVEEAPYTSINASNTVATTSFAGFESAGTTLTVTPHIAQGDHLTLDYSFNFSNFTGAGSSGVPPPRATNSFSGSMEVPDGHTIIIGGLVKTNEADSVSEVPLLGRIPLIGALFQNSDRSRSNIRVFSFVRATILRDDQFEDLKLVTEGELSRAKLKNQDYPESTFQWMK